MPERQESRGRLQNGERGEKKSRIKDFSTGPLASVTVVVGSVLVGIVLSAFLPDIQRASPVSWFHGEWNFDGEIVWSALAFWTLFSIVAVTACVREYHTYREAKHDKKELRDNIDSVRQVARTMPPKDYLQKFSVDYFDSSFETDNVYAATLEAMLNNKGPQGNRESVNETIRIILDAMINLALSYDTPHFHHDIKYSANIMWVRLPNDPRDTHIQEELWESAQRLAGYDNPSAFFQSVDFLLVLDQNLSTNSTNEGIPERDDLNPLCLGHRIGEAGEGFNLPGAPETLETGHYCHVTDSHQIADTLTQYGQRERESVRDYYRRDKRGRSILSMPVMGYDPSTGASKPSVIAVVSVYRNAPGIMKDDQRAYMFYHQMAPFLSLLYRLCWIRNKLDELAGGPITAYTTIDDAAPIPEEEA